MSFFDTVDLLPEDPILGITALFQAHKNPKKVNLGIGAYQNAQGKPFVLQSVKKAEAQILQTSRNKEYLPIAGNPEYITQALRLLFGNTSPFLNSPCIFAAQTLGGSGALSLGSEFIAQEFGNKIFISNPSWSNHKGLLSRSGLKVETYPYYDELHHQLDFKGMCACIRHMPPGSVILLQPCCHNPTGMDLSMEQWQILSDLIHEQRVFPFFDLAYQGFSQSLDEDAQPIRTFAQQGHLMMVAQSFSKNFGLYGERVGVLSIITRQAETVKKIASHIKLLIRQNYSNPPRHGAAIISTILQDPLLRQEWILEVEEMKSRIQEMRTRLFKGLSQKCPHHDFTFLTNQRGMFSYTGINEAQAVKLREDYGIFMALKGRINVAGLTSENLDYVIDSFGAVIG